MLWEMKAGLSTKDFVDSYEIIRIYSLRMVAAS
jgi:hypothetical protein